MIKRIFTGDFKEHRACFDRPEEVKNFIQTASGRFQVTFEKEPKSITQKQRGFYYGLLIPMVAKASGHSDEEVDGVFHRAFLTVNRGQPNEYVRSTADGQMPEEEYTDYVRQCVQRAAEHSIIVEGFPV